MVDWKDTTGYSRDKERIPTTWSLDVGELRITVTCGHIYYKGQWVMHCAPWFDTRELRGVYCEDDAKRVALEMVREKVHALYAAIHKVLP